MTNISLHEVEKGEAIHEATGIMAMHPKWLHPNKASWASDVTTRLLRASSVTKPRTREANTSIKHQSKQT